MAAQPGETTAVTRREATPSERFSLAVERQYTGEIGQLQMTEYDKILAQHLFVRIDAAFAEMNARKSGNDIPVSWNNVNMRNNAEHLFSAAVVYAARVTVKIRGFKAE